MTDTNQQILENYIEAFRKTLDSLMAEQGVSAKALSKAAGLGETSVRDAMERYSKNGPTLKVLVGLSQGLNCSVAHLLGEDDGPNKTTVTPLVATNVIFSLIKIAEEEKLELNQPELQELATLVLEDVSQSGANPVDIPGYIRGVLIGALRFRG